MYDIQQLIQLLHVNVFNFKFIDRIYKKYENNIFLLCFFKTNNEHGFGGLVYLKKAIFTRHDDVIGFYSAMMTYFMSYYLLL